MVLFRKIIILNIFFPALAFASLQELTQEFLQKNYNVVQAVSQLELTKYGFDLEDSKYNWNLTADSFYRDSKLDILNPNLISEIKSKINSITLSKTYAWGGTISFGNSLEINELRGRQIAGFTQSFNYTQDIGANLLGRQSQRALDIAEINIEVSKNSVHSSREKLLYDFVSLYTQASLLKSLLDYQAEAYQRALKRKNLIQRRVKDGLREKVDLYQADSSLLQQEEELIAAENNFQDSLLKLSENLHRKISKKEIDYLSFVSLPMPEGKVEQNKDLQALKEKLTVVNLELANADDSMFPALTLRAGIRNNSFDSDTATVLSEGLLGRPNRELSVGLNLSWNIGRQNEKTQLAMKRVENMLLVKEVESTQKNLESFQNVVINKIKNLEQINANSQKRVKLAQKTLKEYNSLYSKGRVDLDTVIRAEESLINTQRTYAGHINSYKNLVYSLSLLYGEFEKYIMR